MSLLFSRYIGAVIVRVGPSGRMHDFRPRRRWVRNFGSTYRITVLRQTWSIACYVSFANYTTKHWPLLHGIYT